MAQDITLMGASFSAVPAVTLPKTGGGTASFTDVTDTTAAAADVASGKYFYTAAGVRTQGTSSGGGSTYGYTLLGQTDLSANTTTTSNTSLGNITVSSAWTKAKIIYVRIRDKAGPRSGYFYGSDVWFVNANAGNNSTTAFTAGARAIISYNNSAYTTYSGTGYGVFGYDINTSGRVRIYTRYNSTNSRTINGTYHCEVWALDWPDGVSPFGS